ncbi:ISL3 family transposase [Alkalibacillus haloalkaliphilus]|uniref:ISL3 family transposase n=1 Tax=Alkalibacillus haloalkaliphilus TaxID=94136 RepID=UPI0002F4B70E|nr:ISL3 family transposase [Alkalibacillus haloalkaliphilus]
MSNNIKNLLDIQDENITFEEDCVTYGTHKGIAYQFIHGRLSYEPNSCLKCGAKKEGSSIYKNGSQKSRITLNMSGMRPTYLVLKKQRFFCKDCQSSFTAETPIVKKHCFISNNVKSEVAVKCSEAQSITNISRDCCVSHATVQRVINDAAKHFKPHYRALPEHLSFDEFKYAKGKMAFEYINAETGEILDTLEGRTNKMIRDHFITYYDLTHRKRVKTVTIDMNSAYVSVIKELFPNADIIIDRFHIIQLINRSMNKTRIKVMNTFNTSNNEDLKKYRRLKGYWKLILKNQSDLLSTEYRYYKLFGQRTERSIVQEMLAYDEELSTNYELYQTLLRAITRQEFNNLNMLLNEKRQAEINGYFRTSIKTLKKHLPYIMNSFKYPYNNGRIEGINNKIKVLNRVAYGYRNFQNYKKRILLHFYFKPASINQNKKLSTA